MKLEIARRKASSCFGSCEGLEVLAAREFTFILAKHLETFGVLVILKSLLFGAVKGFEY